MARKILAWTLIVLSSIFLLASAAGIVAAWIYNEPLTREVTARLNEVDDELSLAQSTLASSRVELERALRIVDATEKVLEKLAEQSASAETILGGIQSSLDDKLLPELKKTRERISTARSALEKFQLALDSVNDFIPALDLSAPRKIVGDLIGSATSIDSEIAHGEEIARQASTFVSDTSYLLGGDLTETRESLQNFLAAIKEYEQKVADWRTQVADLKENFPKWIDRASLSLTFFLLWFALSQFGLFLHGRTILRGQNPLDVLRSQ
jgi:F0F1-type ATP synthase membrane subunit b/b'